MQTLIRGCLAVALLAAGYALGASGVLTSPALLAQDTGTGLPDETLDRIRVADNALQSAAQALQAEGRYNPATAGVNGFAVRAGGIDAIADLESGRGVDPETFAALYAGRATQEVADHLDFDEEDRLRYKNKVVRMYSIDRLKRMFAEQDRIAGQDENILPQFP